MAKQLWIKNMSLNNCTISAQVSTKNYKTPSLLKKQLNDIIASPLVELVNKLFQSDIFPDIFEIAKVI